MRLSTIILLIGAGIVTVGAGLSLANIQPYADYVLLSGALLIILRGFIRNHEKDGVSSRQTGGSASAEEGKEND